MKLNHIVSIYFMHIKCIIARLMTELKRFAFIRMALMIVITPRFARSLAMSIMGIMYWPGAIKGKRMK